MAELDPDKIGKPLNDQHPRKLGRYEILRVLGQGGMGTVFLARQVNLGRLVALKLLGGARKVRDDWRQRFELEIDALARLHHPNIVAILDRSDDDQGPLYYVMEFIDGVPLRKFIGKPQKLPAVVRITYKLGQALERVHAEGLVHRDLKPDNVLIDRYGEVKLTDFGIVKPLQKPGEQQGNVPMLTGQGAAIGTAAYMAPEQLFGRGEIGPGADVYALGVCFHEVVTGVRPEPDMSKVTQLIRGLPEWIDQFLDWCLHVDPKRRFQTGADVCKFLAIHANKVKGEFPTVGRVPGMALDKLSQSAAAGLQRPLPEPRSDKSLPGVDASDIAPPDPTVADPSIEIISDGDAAASGGASSSGRFGRDLSAVLKAGRERRITEETGPGTAEPVTLEQSDAPLTVRPQTARAQTKAAQAAKMAKAQKARDAVSRLDRQAAESEDEFLLDLDEDPVMTRPVAPMSRHARGQRPDWWVRACPRCKGTGQMRRFMVLKKTCSLCRGQGRVYREHRELRRLRRVYWLLMALCLGVAGLLGWAGMTRVLDQPPLLPFLGAAVMPLIVLASIAAVLLIVLWALDVQVQQKWAPTDLLPSGGQIWPVRGSLRQLGITGAVVVALMGGGGYVLIDRINADPATTGDDDDDPGNGGPVGPSDPNQPPQVPALLDRPHDWDERNEAGYWHYRRSERDRAAMVYIPPATVRVGSHPGNAIGEEETPPVELRLNGFFIDVHEINSRQYAQFLTAAAMRGATAERVEGVWVARDTDGHALCIDAEGMLAHGDGPLLDNAGRMWLPTDLPSVRGGLVYEPDNQRWRPRTGDEEFPMVFVTWHGARAYAKWVGGRLPTEVEWELVARGPSPGMLEFPWGLWEDPGRANTASRAAGRLLADDDALRQWILEEGNSRRRLVAEPVDADNREKTDRSRYLVRNLAGNVREWCHNAWHADLYDQLAADPSRRDAMLGPPDPYADAPAAAIRGGAFDESRQWARIRQRRSEPLNRASWRIGFRVLVPVPED